MLKDTYFTTGVELETASGSNGSTSYYGNKINNAIMLSGLKDTWISETDGSCGFEYKSPVYKSFDEFIKSTTIACSTLKSNGIKVSRKCGTHVHIGWVTVKDLTAKYRAFRVLHNFENVLLALIPPWQNRAHFCVKLGSPIWQQTVGGKSFQPLKDFDGNSRYKWFNANALDRHNTVEFRHLNGTLDAKRIAGWVAVIQCILGAAVYEKVRLEWNYMDYNSESVSALREVINSTRFPVLKKAALDFINTASDFDEEVLEIPPSPTLSAVDCESSALTTISTAASTLTTVNAASNIIVNGTVTGRIDYNTIDYNTSNYGTATTVANQQL